MSTEERDELVAANSARGAPSRRGRLRRSAVAVAIAVWLAWSGTVSARVLAERVPRDRALASAGGAAAQRGAIYSGVLARALPALERAVVDCEQRGFNRLLIVYPGPAGNVVVSSAAHAAFPAQVLETEQSGPRAVLEEARARGADALVEFRAPASWNVRVIDEATRDADGGDAADEQEDASPTDESGGGTIDEDGDDNGSRGVGSGAREHDARAGGLR